ncbi:hypothetical protein B7764_22045 (plasmid) [Pantoea ananatis]|nr:hypothetical protein B7764_22045 [Pantoea ananatis]
MERTTYTELRYLLSYEKAPRFRREKGGQVSGKRQGRNRRAHEGASRGTPGIFIVLSGFATSDLSVDFCDARQGGGAYGKTPATRPFTVPGLLLAFS